MSEMRTGTPTSAMSTTSSSDGEDPSDRSLGELVSQLSTDFSDLVSTQLELAKGEIKEEATRAGKGAGMLTGGALAASLGMVMLYFPLAWALSEAMPTGFAFL